MFNQSEKKLKTWATIQGMFFSVVAIVLGAVIYSAAAATDNNAVGLLLGVIVAVVVWFLSMLSVWALYSFADLVEYTKANNEILARAHIDAHLDDKISVGELAAIVFQCGLAQPVLVLPADELKRRAGGHGLVNVLLIVEFQPGTCLGSIDRGVGCCHKLSFVL